MKKNKKIKILIYGGCFDPVHKGHVYLLKKAIKNIKPDKIYIVPNSIPPLKNHDNYSYPKNRLDMCNLAFSKIKNVIVSDYEIINFKDKVSYTYQTIQHFKKQFPQADLYLLIGSDRYDDFKKWKNWEYIINNAHVVVGNRTNKQIQINDAHFISININPIIISSQQLRIEPNKKYLDKKIIKYIKNHKMYVSIQVKNLMSEKRYLHTLRVKDTALEIAKAVKYKYLNKIYYAAMYHDIAKEFDQNKTLNLVKKFDKYYYPTIHTLHGLAAAKYAKKHFNVSDKEILNAISEHVIPHKKCSTLAKIIYCADKLEPSRTKEDVSDRVGYLNLVKKDLNKGFDKLYMEIKGKY